MHLLREKIGWKIKNIRSKDRKIIANGIDKGDFEDL